MSDPGDPAQAGLELPRGLRHVRKLGASPTSTVYLVEDGEGRRYALKVLRASVARHPKLRERWAREARLLGEIEHASLVRAFGQCEVGGRPALLLEYVPGPTLRAALESGPLPWEQAARYGMQLARALARLHRHGAVHRDVKPHNVLLHPERGAVLADLGLVRLEEDPALTRHGAALGTPAYMSPEQARDPSGVDEQADVYSLGATLHHALSGAPPFLGRGVGEVLHRVLHEEPEPLPATVPEGLRRVVATAMAKDPDRRYPGPAELGRDLGRVLLGRRPKLATRAGRRRRRRVAAAVVAVLLTATLVPFLLPRWSAGGAGGGDAGEGGVAVGPESAGAAPTASRDGAPGPPPPPQGPTDWLAPHVHAFDRALAEGRFLDARARLEATARLGVPDTLDREAASAARASWLEAAAAALAAAAEREAARAQELLEQAVADAEDDVLAGRFDGEAWSQGVRESWRRAGLRVDAFPLGPGGADPAGRLRVARVALENRTAAARRRLALAAVPPAAARSEALLAAGDFDAAARVWDGLERSVFDDSPDARVGRERAVVLAALAHDLAARLETELGRTLSVELAGGTPVGGVVERAPRRPGAFVLDYRGQSQVPLDPLRLEPGFLVAWLRGAPDPWLEAQLLALQGRLDEALERIRDAPAAPGTGRDPMPWVRAWERAWAERNRGPVAGAEASPEAGAGADAGTTPGAAAEHPEGAAAPPSPPSRPDPRRDLLTGLAERFPDATLTLRGDRVEVTFADVALGPEPWRLDLRDLLRGWELASWELVWRLPPGATPPRRVTWLDDVVLVSGGRRGLPVLRLGDAAHPGFGILADLSRQRLVWEDGEVALDGLPIGPWRPRAPRGPFTAAASEPLVLETLRLGFERR